MFSHFFTFYWDLTTNTIYTFNYSIRSYLVNIAHKVSVTYIFIIVNIITIIHSNRN